MNNREINDYNISSRTFSCLYGKEYTSPNHQNNKKYIDNNFQYNLNHNYNENNINNLSLNQNNFQNQNYEQDAFKQRINYLKNSNINSNINYDYLNSKNNSLAYTDTTARSYFNTNNSNNNNKNKFKDPMNYAYHQNNNIYNSINENGSDENLNNNTLKPNQLLFFKNMESLKNMKYLTQRDDFHPIIIYNQRKENNIDNNNNNNILDYNNSSLSKLKDNQNNNVKLKTKKQKSKINNSKSVQKNKITKKKNSINKKKNNSSINNNSKLQLNQNLNNPKKNNNLQNPIKKSNSFSKIPIKKINSYNFKIEEKKENKLRFETEREISKTIKANLEKEFIKYKEDLNKLKDESDENDESESEEKDFEKIKVPKYKHISSLDEISKFDLNEQIKRLFHNNLQLYQELNDLRNENYLLRKELKRKNNIKGNNDNEDKFKNFILNENEKLNQINRNNEKILDGLIEKINEITKKKNIENEEDENLNIISYNELSEEPDKIKFILDKILPLNKKNKYLNNKNFNMKLNNDLIKLKNFSINNKKDVNDIKENIIKTHKKSLSSDVIKKENNENKTEFYDYYNKERNKNCYACLFGHNNYTKGYSPLMCSPNKDHLFKDQQDKNYFIQSQNEIKE